MGINSPSYGIKRTNETRKKISDALIGVRVGELHPNSHLTGIQVSEIRKLSNEGTSQKELSLIYNTSKSNISKIITRKNWTHI